MFLKINKHNLLINIWNLFYWFFEFRIFSVDFHPFWIQECLEIFNRYSILYDEKIFSFLTTALHETLKNLVRHATITVKNYIFLSGYSNTMKHGSDWALTEKKNIFLAIVLYTMVHWTWKNWICTGLIPKIKFAFWSTA